MNFIDPLGLVRTPWGFSVGGGFFGQSWNEFVVAFLPVYPANHGPEAEAIGYGWMLFGPTGATGQAPTGGFGSKPIHRKWGKQFSCDKTPQQLISSLRNDFSSFANYSNPQGPNAVFTPGPLSPGGTVLIDTSYNIGHYAVGQTNAVTVSSMTSTNFTFTVVAGQHFMAGGSTVSFSATELVPGVISFWVSADGATANALYSAADSLGGHAAESATWDNLLNNVAALCRE